MSRKATTLESVFARISRLESGCWEWKGCTTRKDQSGYGVVGYQGQNWLVHRLLYGLIRGSIPDGLEMDHICRNRRCCNPDHLEAVTAKENNKRGVNGRLKTHCVNGHEYTEENVFLDKKGRRNCRVCDRAKGRAYNDALKEQRRLEGRKPAPALRTHCPQGHEYSPENTLIVSTSGERQCRECHRQRAREYAAKRDHGRGPQALRTHCPRGHEYTPENTRVYKGGRFCRECSKISCRERYHRSKEYGEQA